jgi:arylsulfatase A-like enzyme
MTDSRPNLIFILADDLGYADLGCTGARDAHNNATDVSPRLDAMAAQGLRFTRGYSNSSVCSPTRFALATGRWQYRLRGAAEEPIASVHGDKVLGLPPDHPTVASLLRDAGYATALVGKWHLGYPRISARACRATRSSTAFTPAAPTTSPTAIRAGAPTSGATRSRTPKTAT